MVYEGKFDYAASIDYQSYDDHRQQLPSRELKKICIDKCRELIESGGITQVLTESKHDKAVSKKLIPELEKVYILTESNKTTISDYFRKGELRIYRRNGKVVVDIYPRVN